MKRICSICGKPIPYNSGSFTWDPKTNEYVHDDCILTNRKSDSSKSHESNAFVNEEEE